MRHRLYMVVPTLLLSIAGFAGDDRPSFSHGLIQASCAPWDGPAVDITLSAEPAECKKRPTGPYIDLGVWRGLPLHAGQTVKFDAGSNDGYGSRCVKEGDCERARSGEIVFETYGDNSGATGHYELHFKSGEVVRGKFEVKWCENRMMCG